MTVEFMDIKDFMNVKEAINKVLEDFPQLKPTKQGKKGFQQLGSDGGNQSQQSTDDMLKQAFGL